MARMRFQNGGYYGFKVIRLVNDIDYAEILFHKMISAEPNLFELKVIISRNNLFGSTEF